MSYLSGCSDSDLPVTASPVPPIVPGTSQYHRSRAGSRRRHNLFRSQFPNSLPSEATNVVASPNRRSFTERSLLRKTRFTTFNYLILVRTSELDAPRSSGEAETTMTWPRSSALLLSLGSRVAGETASIRFRDYGKKRGNDRTSYLTRGSRSDRESDSSRRC